MYLNSAEVTEDHQYFSCRSLPQRMFSRLLVLTLAILVSGCSAFKGFPERATDPSSDLLQLKPDIQADQITACLDAPTDDERLACRNRFIAARLYAIDIQFSEFEESLFLQTRTTGFATTLATLGLTSGAAVAGGTASQILSGAAAFIIGGREAFQKEVLAERTLVAIHTAMRGGRTRVAIRLRTGLRQSVDEYPLALGLADLNDYYNAGTVLGALVGITESVGTEAREEAEKLVELEQAIVLSAEEKVTATPPAPEIRFAETDDEKNLAPSQLEKVQDFLCVDVDAAFGPETRGAIGIWQGTNDYSETGSIDTTEQARGLLQAAEATTPLDGPDAKGSCDRAKFRNVFERLRYGTRVHAEGMLTMLGELRRKKNLQMTLPEPETTNSINDLRDAITVAGQSLDVDTSAGVTLAFENALLAAIQ